MAAALVCVWCAHAEANPYKKLVAQARRAVAIGPVIGAAGVVDYETPYVDAELSAGLAVFAFEPPILDTDRLQDLGKDRLKEYGPKWPHMSHEEREQAKAQIRADLRSQLDPSPETIPDPKLDLVLEGGWHPRAGAWHIRASLGFGVGPVTIGPTLLVEGEGGSASFAAGPEVALHLLLGAGPRPLALQLFARADFFVANREKFEDTASLGARLLFDLF